jgi:3-methylfumaryl-CoA hydratase
MDIKHLQEWVGKTELISDQITGFPFAALSATLARDNRIPEAGELLPPLWHWLYFLPRHKQSEVGPDGHATRGRLLPPVPLPRRMWAGGRLTFKQPLRVGEPIERTSRVVSVEAKQGRTGNLVFVLVRHEIANPAGVAILEEHDIVYRDMPAPGAPQPAPQRAPSESAWEWTIKPDGKRLPAISWRIPFRMRMRRREEIPRDAPVPGSADFDQPDSVARRREYAPVAALVLTKGTHADPLSYRRCSHQ